MIMLNVNIYKINLFVYNYLFIYFLASCPSFDLHLYAHIDHSSLNRCVFTPVPHQTGKKIREIK